MDSAIRYLNPAGLFDANLYGFSHVSVARVEHVVHVAGQTSADHHGVCDPGDDLGMQTRKALSSLATALRCRGATTRDLAALRLFIVDLDRRMFPAVLAEISSFLAGAEPPPATLGRSHLAAVARRADRDRGSCRPHRVVMDSPARRQVVVVAFDGVQLLDVAGPIEVFTGASRVTPRARYDVHVAATTSEVTTPSGVTLRTRELAAVTHPVDALIVAGGDCLLEDRYEPLLLNQIGRLARSARRRCSVCSGALLLASVGLLGGRRATTRWAAAELLASRHPDVRVDADPIFIEDNGTWTSAGVSAAVDLSLALIAADLGPSIANRIARWL